VMKPHTTSAYAGALNIEICDEGFARRSRQRKPYKVNHGLGQMMIPQYDQHFGVFWDEGAFELLVSLLTDDEPTILGFDLMTVHFTR